MTAVQLPGCLIVNGMPGAGKSTISTLVARLLPRAARVKGDDVNEMILSGRVWFAGDPPEEAARQVELCHRNMCSLAANFVDFGFSVLMDTVVANRAELDFLFGLLAPRPVRLLTLAPGAAVCRQRNATREHMSDGTSRTTTVSTPTCGRASAMSAGGSTLQLSTKRKPPNASSAMRPVSRR